MEFSDTCLLVCFHFLVSVCFPDNNSYIYIYSVTLQVHKGTSILLQNQQLVDLCRDNFVSRITLWSVGRYGRSALFITRKI